MQILREFVEAMKVGEERRGEERRGEEFGKVFSLKVKERNLGKSSL